MTNNNRQIWDQVWQTDPSHTKPVSEGKRTYTSINATYMVRQATDLWGPLGAGWGYEIIEERFDQGGPITGNEGQVVATMVMHTLRLKLWYMHEGKRAEVEHFGHTPYVYRTRYGAQTDMDAPKKSLTDALKKCLSMLGFSADVFLGMYDMPDYVQEQQVRENIEQADSQDDAAAEASTEFYDWLADQLRGYGLVPNKAALRVMHSATVSKAKRRAQTLRINPEQVGERLDKRYREVLSELSPKTELVCQSCGSVQEGSEGSPCAECGQKTAPAGGANGKQGD